MFILYLVKTSNDFLWHTTRYQIIHDTALHCPRPVATELSRSESSYNYKVWVVLQDRCYRTPILYVADLTAACSGLQQQHVIDEAIDQRRGQLCACVRLTDVDNLNICFDHINSILCVTVNAT